MNAAEKAAKVREEARESKITDMYREALKAYNCVREIEERNRKRLTNRSKMISISDREQAAYLRAAKLFAKCAKKGHVESMECLADMYFNGPFIVNSKKAFKLYKRGAELGSVICMNGLVRCYQSGRGIKPSYTLAQHWLERAEQEKNNQEEE